ncbi:MAG: DEAD/DEAH box helicase family protein [Rubrobacter sp.]|nr:DEAD/DEAH box helicase family protein [Rubrobacter sp.]
MKPDERAFEEHIANSLVERGGYRTVKIGNASGDFDPERGLDTVELFAFVAETQPETWDRLVRLHGGDAQTRRRFVDRLAKELDARGTVDVLRHGIVDLGVTIRLCFFEPAHGLTPQLVARYEANRLTVTRQLPYEIGTTRTLDLALFVNGLPVATAEVKNPLTGQNVEDAKTQYRKDRDPKNVTLARRAVVHFAVDPEEVAMTTRLDGGGTRFLPFNRGNGGGKGNPQNPEGHRTAYLWERVWEKDAWLDLLGRFVHVERPAKGSKSPGTVIFPRYHQWDAVLGLTAHARRHGPGESYLIQHSAGSGKSNTIAWLAHRLSSLHDANDSKVFDKIVVITDRVVLDKQLQETIYQFEHAHGVVVKIDESSSQLAEALTGQTARVIITTLQKFPFVLDKAESLPARSYAVLVDEAHSSQTGETAKEMKKVLGSGRVLAEDLAAEEPDVYGTELTNPAEDALAREAAVRGQQDNLSFFAFTATPKGRTLEMFGAYSEEAGHRVPFHVYSMRQAIEEGFIHDVLASYVTYGTYWKIEKAVKEDPEYDSRRAGAAIARFVTLHEHNLSQKAHVIVEHFRRHVTGKIGGKAKAMVVTSSRKHAVRMAHALRKHANAQGYDALGILVAFSGTVEDEGATFTEAQMNGFGERQTPREFEEDWWQFLVVADKYQTGFDQPLLYAMYVDKVLTGLAAVQTLSRLNRRAEGKDGTFVLDFRNDADAVRGEFETYYGKTVAPPTDPNLLYDTRHALDEYDVLRNEEITKVADLLLTGESRNNHARIHAALAPAMDRFQALQGAEQENFRDALTRFVRTYSFLSQVVSFTDAGLERDYQFCRALSSFVKRGAGASLDLGSEVELTHLHMEQTFEGSVALGAGQGIVRTIYDGTGSTRDPEASPLSRIIATLNERFGLNLTEADRLHLESIAQEMVDDETVQRQAAANSLENFGVQFPKHFETAVVDRLGGIQDLSYQLLDDQDLSEQVRSVYLPLVYGRAKVAWQEHCPIGDLLGPPPKESVHLEYKSTLRVRADTGELFKPLQAASLKTVAAFLNSWEGGTLLIGVADDGSVFGLDSDYATLRKDGKDDRDLFGLHLQQTFINALGEAAAVNVGQEILSVSDRDLCRVHVKPSSFPVEATVVEVDKKGQHIEKKLFYGRFGNGTRQISDPKERERYQVQVWGN